MEHSKDKEVKTEEVPPQGEETLEEAVDKSEDVQAPKVAKHKKDVPEYVEHAKKMRRNLVVAIVALIAIICVIVGLMVFYLLHSQNASVQQEQTSDVSQMEGEASEKTTTKDEKTSTVPDLASLIGVKADEVAQKAGHGAQVTSDEAKDEENNPVKRVMKLTLTNDVGSDSTGNPTIVASANSDGNVTSVTYSSSTKTLGYGTMSFTDAIQNEKIIEKVMKEAGLTINSADVVLPEDKSSWTTYTDDGKRISREEKEFSGEVDGKKWSARLAYDYTVSLATDNLSDTLRNITITISS